MTINLEEWQNHVRTPRPHDSMSAWCGAVAGITDWYFEGVDHALASMLAGSRLMPCPACVKAIIAKLDEAPK